LTQGEFQVPLLPVGKKTFSPACLAAIGALVWGCGARTGLGAFTCLTDAQCDDDDTCTIDACVPPEGDAGGGQCTHQPVPVGTACDDGNPCTSGDACTAGGSCVGMANNACLPPPVDPTCPAGCASGTPDFPPAIPLVPPALPASCSGGFEMNTPPQQIFTVQSISPGGAQARTLDIEIATYRAPDHISITAVDASGTEYPLVDTCHLQTSTYSDPTNGCTRPPDDSIRQYTVSITAGTRSLSIDMTGACTPTYMRVLGLCDFAVTPFFSGCEFRLVP
jgi:hypothetical protein